MRKAQKKQIEEMITLMAEAQAEIKNAIRKKNISLALDLLEQCQQAAIQVGTSIDALEGEGHPTVTLLEQYCELVYKLHEELADGALKPGADAAAYAELKLDSLWKQINQSAEEEIPARLEVVFCPYKAAMWDSLESVWKAAAEDPNCDAYVIPIPYFDKLPNGAFAQEHYEGLEYPEYVPITYYKSYNFEERRPDMVFIHNPYDENNFVTTVHPAFYSSQLKQYTEKLIYIPYFNTGGAMSDMFKYTAVYNNCDYIVTQSEEQNEYVADEFGEKVLPFGSPKYDRLINYKISTEDIPASWENKLSKKIVFYNTSISGMLEYGGAAINKMMYVFSVFENADITLLWRPHPLLKSTLKTMRPDLLPLYERAEAAFSKVKNGILDTTPDATMAVKLSDAYIGEETSSMVHMFGVLGKPIFLTDMTVTHNWDDEKQNVKIFDCVYENNYYWGLCGDWNGLLKVAQNGNVEQVYEIPEEKRDNPRLYNSMISYGGKLYLIPYTAKAIAVFDMATETFTKISLDIPRKHNFSKAFFYKNSIYMVPTYYKGILKLDCISGEWICFEKPVTTVRQVYDNTEDPFCFNGCLLEKNKLLMATTFGECVVEINLDTQESEVHILGNEKRGYWCMAGTDNKYLLGSNEERHLVYWDKERKTVKELFSYPDEWKGEANCFYTMELLQNEVFVFPKMGNRILRISLDDLQLSSFITDENHIPTERKKGYYSWPSNYLMTKKVDEETVLVQSAYEYGLTLVKTTGKTEHVPVCVPEDMFPYGYEDLFCRRSKNLPWVLRENNRFSLSSFLKYVALGEHDTKKQIQEYGVVAANLDGTCGEKIYKAIVDKL